MKQVCQLPLGVASSGTVDALGTFQNGQQHGVSHFAQSRGAQTGMDRGTVGLVDLPGQKLHLLG